MKSPTGTSNAAANLQVRLLTVHGRVQGVWFRDSTRREAERLGISGHAINLPDGTVEVLAWGTSEALAALESWLHVGPPLARVSHVVVGEPPATAELPPMAFSIG